MLGSSEASRILKAIKSRIEKGEPDKSGKTLKGTLSGCRRIRVGESLKSGHGKSNHQIESEFARRRSVSRGEADKQ
ncbi:type II toxin-antitoxin system RelE/ParE family toxin [Endozoicomonas sp. SCSIO W0465]|uniref:type II toxin-antitoxin system RelE family toxin n=1 Tax=Endozoicomonas sp. SCSIO W0465 TaxID=2918516 RepID=UPI00207651FF|nr:hypothetical protein [Endozoicomonas sp. SCSIO W0465]USE39141.1 hypothetical protein MJO57_13870 [Endozoicomonas sp. SCSIO W0465]